MRTIKIYPLSITAVPPTAFRQRIKREELFVRHLFNEETWEFTAKTVGDLGKNIVSIGFASYFFKDLPLPIRIVFVIIGIACLIGSTIMISKKGEK